MQISIRLIAFVVLIAGIAGCSDGTAMGTVSGTVTVDGAVAPEGSSIMFIPKNGQGVTAGGPLVNGKYSTKVPIGVMRVEIRAPKPSKTKAPPKDGPGGPGFGPGGGGLTDESLPVEYHEKSTLTFEVKAGTQEKNWECSTKAKP
jgi:hypothetical protein